MGPSKSLEMSPFDRAHDFLLTFYCNCVVSDVTERRTDGQTLADSKDRAYA